MAHAAVRCTEYVVVVAANAGERLSTVSADSAGGGGGGGGGATGTGVTT